MYRVVFVVDGVLVHKVRIACSPKYSFGTVGGDGMGWDGWVVGGWVMYVCTECVLVSLVWLGESVRKDEGRQEGGRRGRVGAEFA